MSFTVHARVCAWMLTGVLVYVYVEHVGCGKSKRCVLCVVCCVIADLSLHTFQRLTLAVQLRLDTKHV
jgi:hypothetical protein